MTPSLTHFTGSALTVLLCVCPNKADAQGRRPGNASRPLAVHDLNLSFSTNSNPNGAWRYGWKQKLDGELSLLTFPNRSAPGNPAALFF